MVPSECWRVSSTQICDTTMWLFTHSFHLWPQSELVGGRGRTTYMCLYQSVCVCMQNVRLLTLCGICFSEVAAWFAVLFMNSLSMERGTLLGAQRYMPRKGIEFNASDCPHSGTARSLPLSGSGCNSSSLTVVSMVLITLTVRCIKADSFSYSSP